MSTKAEPEDYPEGIVPGQEKWVPTLFDGIESAAIQENGERPYYAARWAGGVHMTCYGDSRREAVENLIEMTPVLLAELVEIGPRIRRPDTEAESEGEG